MDIAFTGEVKVRTGPSKQWSEGEIEAEIKKFDDKIQDARDN
jgi:hypothetical protein